MNLYLLIAIAFGAITGVNEAPVARASVILSRADGQGSQVARKEILRSAQDDGGSLPLRVSATLGPAAVFKSPLTGAATPRAPANV